MIKIEFPEHPFKIKEEEGKEVIFDGLRKLWLRLSPEEWVRQNFVQYLIQIKNYPSALIAMEKEIMLGEMAKRFDILVYDADHAPWLMVECKSMEVKLDERVVEQVLRYNMSVPVKYMVITNGSYTFAFEKKDTGLKMLDELPPSMAGEG